MQRLITLSLVASACGWLLYFGRGQPLLGVAGFIAITLGYSIFLALEFILLRQVNKADPAPQATWHELLGAWLGETMTAAVVFCWRQPFRSNAYPDQLTPVSSVSPVCGRRGVVFIHGFFCNRGLWNPWLKQLHGHAFIAVNLEPLFCSIDDYVPLVEDAVRRVTETTGQTPLVVCHSMGGLVARAWLKTMKADARVHHVVTIGTPHRGTWLARFGHGANGNQMRLLSDWQSQLDHDMPAGRHALFTCWYSNCDNIVFPASTATLPDADNRLIHGAAHLQLAFVPKVMNETLALLNENRE